MNLLTHSSIDSEVKLELIEWTERWLNSMENNEWVLPHHVISTVWTKHESNNSVNERLSQIHENSVPRLINTDFISEHQNHFRWNAIWVLHSIYPEDIEFSDIWAISKWAEDLYNRFINKACFGSIEWMKLFKRRWNAYKWETQINKERVRYYCPFEDYQSQVQAFYDAIINRWKILEKRWNFEIKKPRTSICNQLIKVWLVELSPKWEYRVSNMAIEPTRYQWSNKLCWRFRWYRHQRSIDEHSFEDAFWLIVKDLSKDLNLTNEQIQELLKMHWQHLYMK